MNEVRISGTVAGTPRFANVGTPLLRFDLRHAVERGEYSAETVTAVRVFGNRALELARQLRHGDSLTIAGLLSGEKYQDRNRETRFKTYVDGREITRGTQS